MGVLIGAFNFNLLDEPQVFIPSQLLLKEVTYV